MSDLLVYIEVRDGSANKASLQALSEAKRLATALNCGVQAVVIGSCTDPASIGKAGASKVHHVDVASLLNYSEDGYATALAKLAEAAGANTVLMAATAQGKDLGPRLAARLGAGLMTDVTSISADGGKIA